MMSHKHFFSSTNSLQVCLASDVCLCAWVCAPTYLCGWHRYVMPGLRLSVQWSRRGDHAVFWVDAEELLYICVPRDHVPTYHIDKMMLLHMKDKHQKLSVNIIVCVLRSWTSSFFKSKAELIIKQSLFERYYLFIVALGKLFKTLQKSDNSHSPITTWSLCVCVCV